MNTSFEGHVIFIAALLYAVNGFVYISQKNYPWGLVWLAYAAANIGLMWAASKGGAQ